ncbi:hypothetical protein UFOVP35_14 [uncultured Caudovirales phage]|uniref:Tail fiber protein n=1 Tax=uncultured Caudovirales phage TaxID=2100421 RepID=A0A6J5KQB0_9CAUD|nr:hypothetical protein UFOVP35_14 [uncultured Caudovirales phage]CAB4124533.1 hypothetical protein UFOVP52_33 [uncultured Caudovirales phage]CAB5219878.1 hypothetical protein UFOVP234_58 [uncultured Caudovirales phage]
MSNFPVFHGITLAQNAFVENLNLEILSTDPTPVNAGRIWFNSTDKSVKFSTLDSSGAVIVRTFKDAESAAVELAAVRSEMAAAMAAEEASRIAGDATTLASAAATTAASLVDAKAYTDAAKAELLGGIPPAVLDTITELAAALENNPNILSVIEGHVNTVQGNLDAEVTRATAAEAAIQSNLDTEVANRISAINTEASARVSGDNALDLRLTTVEGQVNGKIGSLTSLTTDDKTSIVAAINEIDAHSDTNAANIAGEITRAMGAEAGLSSDIASEATRAQAAEGQLTSDLSSEVSRAQAAEGVLTAAVAAEVSARTAAVSAEATRAQGVEAGLRSDLTQEIADRVAGDQAEMARAQAAEAILTSAVSAEAAARAAAVTAEANARTAADTAEATARASAVTAEAAARVAGDADTLSSANAYTDSSVAAEATARAAAITSLNSTAAAYADAAVAVEAAAREALATSYNATVFTFEASASGTVHTIVHGLNDMFVGVDVKVQRSNGKYYNDVVCVEEVDANTVKVYLSTALKVKAICRSAAAL